MTPGLAKRIGVWRACTAEGVTLSQDEFVEFYEEWYGEVVRTVALAIGDRTHAEDATQEAFLRAFRRWRSVRTMERPGAWLLVVAMNAARRRWRRAPAIADAAVPERSVDDHANLVVASVAVGDALATLTDRQRAIVVLRYLADLSTAEVARALRCADGTVRATLHQALTKLRISAGEHA